MSERPGFAPPPVPPPGPVAASPLLPILLTLILAALASGLGLTWLLPPILPPAAEPVARFIDVTAESGVNFVHQPAADAAETPTTLGGGVVCFDFDGDGHPDLFFVNGQPWPWETRAPAEAPNAYRCALYRNDGTGHFTDVTAAAGLAVGLQGMGAAAGDYDNDGHPDLFITGIGGNRLFHNRGDGTFEDVTAAAGVGGDDSTWSMGACWVDYDGDGRLDLIVSHYARWPREVPLKLAFAIARLGRSYGTPLGFLSAFPTVYRNLGGGRFAEVPDGAGLRAVDPQTGLPPAEALAVVPFDANGDGRLDLMFSYQTGPATFFLNRGDGGFRPWMPGRDERHEGAAAGLMATSSLSPPVGPDERLVALLAATALGKEPTDPATLQLPTKFGVALLDYDHDGHLELFSGGGQAEPDISRFDTGRRFEATPALYWHQGSRWVAVLPTGAWARPVTARGVAAADFDGDGSVDIVIAQNGGPPRLLRNDQRRGVPWLQIDLVAKHGARDADGARVEVHTPRRILIQTKVPAMSYLAQSSSTLTFGLGEDARVRKIVIHWPSGTDQEIRSPGIDRRLVITEP